METATMDPKTKMSDLLDSPRAAAALKRAGIVTVGDLGEFTMDELNKIKGVGQRTAEQIESLGAVKRAENFDHVEEGPHPLHLMSPREKYVIWVLRGDRMYDAERRTNMIVPPLLIQFDGGRGVLTRETYLKRKYFRDPVKIQEHLDANKPWRQEAADWLKSRTKYGLEYTLMTD